MTILDEIKDCEQKAADIRSEAALKARELLRDANKRAEDATAERMEKVKGECRALADKAAAKSQQAAKAYLEDERKKDAAFATTVAVNIPNAVNYIVKEVSRT